MATSPSFSTFRANALATIFLSTSLVLVLGACKTASSGNESQTLSFGKCKVLTGEQALRDDANIQLSEKLLHVRLTVDQMQAINRAHVSHADDFTPDQIAKGNVRYSDQALQDKYDILSKAGFGKYEIKTLMDAKIVGFFGELLNAAGEVAGAQVAEQFRSPLEVTTSWFPQYTDHFTTAEQRQNVLTGEKIEVERDLAGNVIRRRTCE